MIYAAFLSSQVTLDKKVLISVSFYLFIGLNKWLSSFSTFCCQVSTVFNCLDRILRLLLTAWPFITTNSNITIGGRLYCETDQVSVKPPQTTTPTSTTLILTCTSSCEWVFRCILLLYPLELPSCFAVRASNQFSPGSFSAIWSSYSWRGRDWTVTVLMVWADSHDFVAVHSFFHNQRCAGTP